MSEFDHPRAYLPGFLSSDQCQELIFVHKSCSTVGYRPNIFSTTLSHLIATNSSHLVIPFVPIRERLKEKVEEVFCCEYELFTEFTGLISWCKGARIGWHSDDNRPYLKQRHFAVVCYLNSYGKEFKGGLFHFQDAEPSTITPVAGDAIIYTADSRNIHSVDEVTEGERLTLTMWFTRDCTHDEDAKLLLLLEQVVQVNKSVQQMEEPYLPISGPSNMYWYSGCKPLSGVDIRWARLHVLGFDIYSETSSLASDSYLDPTELSNRPLKLVRGDWIVGKVFINSLHALQVVHFYYWRVSSLLGYGSSEFKNSMQLIQPLEEKIKCLSSYYLDGYHLAEMFSFSTADKGPIFDWDNFFTSIPMWEDYVQTLWNKLVIGIPEWVKCHSIFSIPLTSDNKSLL